MVAPLETKGIAFDNRSIKPESVYHPTSSVIDRRSLTRRKCIGMVEKLSPAPTPNSQDSPSKTAILEIRLFGQPQYCRDNTLLPPLATRKTQSLLAYLILYRARPHSRDELATLFWGDLGESRSRRSLATALWRIRRSLADDDFILADSASIQFNPRSHFWLDVAEFQNLLAENQTSHETDRIQRAVQLYRGDLLEDVYDDWCIEERYRLEELYLQALKALVVAHENTGQPKDALRYVGMILARDPLQEELQRTAIRLYMQLGDRAEAMRQARWCRELIHAELHTEPSAETLALCDEYLGPNWRREPVGEIPVSRGFKQTPLALVLERPPFVGRDAEWQVLLEHWNQVQSGRGRFVLLNGEAGIGKTRLVQELCEYVRQRGGWIAEGHCYETERGLPHTPLTDILRSVLAVCGAGIIKQLSPWQATELARLVPELGEQLPTLRGQTIPTESEQTRLFNALISFLLKLARQNPVLVVVEDLHWAHDSTLAWVHLLARQLQDAAILLVATHRDEEINPAHPLHSWLIETEQKKSATRLLLRPLSRESVAQWIEGASSAQVAQIYRQTEGNPFFILETLRALVEKGQMQLVEGRWVDSQPLALPIPDSVRQVIQERLNRLSPETRQAAEVAAVIGRAFDFDVLERAGRLGEQATLEALDELQRRQLIREGSRAFARDYEFDHYLVREVISQGLHHRRRQSLHLRIAEALTVAGNDNSTAGQAAYHYIRAEAWSKAQEFLLKAGDLAGTMAADAEALTYYQQALEAYERAFGDRWDPIQRATLERKMGELYFRRGEYTQALDHLRRSLTYLGRPLPASSWGIRRAILCQAARQIGHGVLARFLRGRAQVNVEEELNAFMPMGWIYALRSDHEPYMLVSFQALNDSEESGYALGVAHGATALGLAADFIPLFGLAEYFHRRAVAVLHQIEHPSAIGFVNMGLAYHEFLMGKESDALEHARHSADAYQKANDPHRWAMAKMIMAYVHAGCGDLAQTRTHAQELVSVGQESADLQVQCLGETLYGTLQQRTGHLEQAVAHLRRAIAFADEIPDHMSRVGIGGELAKCYLCQGDWQQAVAILETSQRVAVEHAVTGDSLGEFLNAMAGVYLYVAEHHDPTWMKKASDACQAAAKHCRGYRPGLPVALRLRGTSEWLNGKPNQARKSWEQSLALAQAMGHRYDAGMTYLEMGTRLGKRVDQEQAQTILAEIGAEWDWARARGLARP